MVRKFEFMDVFSRNSRENREQTTSGALLTLTAIAIIGWLFKQQISLYFELGFEPQVLLDTARNERLDIFVDIEFPHLPCDMLSVDAMDIAGEIQAHVEKDLVKQDIDKDGKPVSSDMKERQREKRDNAIAKRKADSSMTRSCYGGRGEDDNSCVSCEDIRAAYAAKGWKFHDGTGFEQCIAEGYPEALKENSQLGCRVTGRISVAKVVGNLHLAPGTSFTSPSNAHIHDLSGYNMDYPYDCSHKIHAFSFSDAQGLVDTHRKDPLQGLDVVAGNKWKVFRYFTKVVASETFYYQGDHTFSNQYSVTKHERDLAGGRDVENPSTFHGVGGIPGIWITYDISPLRIVNVERRKQNFGALLLNMCAILGAVATSAALLDRGVYEIDKALRARKTL